ncbi:hypothetical protein CKAN_00503200 [Cinnamomum micranthum f. kanehirae]|uniref:J domain-containing protein n=1 Tax=Cinnamomum micranthum f. kanehirae TaxID=337451 RepID=A0A443NDI3_9MAGN|nr:hypothetical protein CKAN_00503200 [Cinnamomum micranthum f. kanehirae]
MSAIFVHSEGDFAGHLEFALKAQKLYPGLDNISQMLTICEVHVSAKSNVVGIEKDWYGILQIPNTADESSIEEQYQKLAILLHANKKRLTAYHLKYIHCFNRFFLYSPPTPPHPTQKKKRFAGAEAAFELVKEAHKVLSNHAQRSLYDNKLQTIIQTTKLMQSLPQSNGNLYSHKQLSIENNFSNHNTSHNQVRSQPHEQTQICPTFWIICPFSFNTRLPAFIVYELIDRGRLLKAASRYVLNQSTHSEHKNISGQGARQVGQQNTIGNLSSTMQCHRNVSRGVTSSEPFSRTSTNAEVAGVYRRKTSKDRDVVGSRAKF